MACSGCGKLPPVRIDRPVAGGNSRVAVKSQVPLRPRRKTVVHTIPHPANDLNKHRV